MITGSGDAGGCGWVRAQPTGPTCKYWRHKSRAYCGAAVAGVHCSPAGLWRELQSSELGGGVAPDWTDTSLLHYCPGCIAKHGLARRWCDTPCRCTLAASVRESFRSRWAMLVWLSRLSG